MFASNGLRMPQLIKHEKAALLEWSSGVEFLFPWAPRPSKYHALQLLELTEYVSELNEDSQSNLKPIVGTF